jgi:hypothetical protein
VIKPNAPPVAVDRIVSLNENTSVIVTLAGSDPDGDSITFNTPTPPAHGTLTRLAANRYRYTTANYSGPDDFTYTVNDGLVDSAPATVNITVIPVNHAPAVPTNRFQRQSNGTTNIALGGWATSQTVVFAATVSDPDAGQTVRLQVEAKPVGTAFDGTVSCQGALVASGTATSCSVTGLTLGAGYHWRLRAVDIDGLAGAWASYALNAEDAADFQVNTRPDLPMNRFQRQADGTTQIPLGGVATSSTVVFAATVTDPDAGQTVRLQVEVKPVGTNFNGSVSCQSGLVASGTAASCTVTGLTPGTSYHWRLRGRDSVNVNGNWVSFATNPETAADFVVAPAP